MTLMEVALTLSIIASMLATIASFCSLARFVRRWCLRKSAKELVP